MPGMELQGFDPRIDQLSKKIQEIKERSGQSVDNSMDSAMNVVENNIGRQEAREATMSLQGLADELAFQQQAVHGLDPEKVAALIADPFED